MRPIKSRELFPQVAVESGLNEQLISDFIQFFYRRVRSALSNLSFTRLFIHDFGTLYIKERAMEKEKRKCNNIFNAYKDRPEGVRKDTILNNIKSQLEKIDTLERIVEKRKQDRKFLTIYKKTYYETKSKAPDTLEGEGEDTGGLV